MFHGRVNVEALLKDVRRRPSLTLRPIDHDSSLVHAKSGSSNSTQVSNPTILRI